MDQQPAQALTSTLSVPTRCDVMQQINVASKANNAMKIVARNCPEQVEMSQLRHYIEIETVSRVYPPKRWSWQ